VEPTPAPAPGPPAPATGPAPASRATAPPAGFGEVLAQARPALEAYARRLVGSRGSSHLGGLEPEDLVQEAQARALRFQERYDPDRPLLPWLRQILLRRFLDELRRHRSAPVEAALGRTSEAATLDPACPEPGAAERLARREEVEHLLGRLGEPERAILEGFHRRGRSLAELAAELRMPTGTIKSHLHRARRRLAAHLEHHEAN
jgi:RNA polymerase sigma-70 factor (ECF subfamily)